MIPVRYMLTRTSIYRWKKQDGEFWWVPGHSPMGDGSVPNSSAQASSSSPVACTSAGSASTMGWGKGISPTEQCGHLLTQVPHGVNWWPGCAFQDRIQKTQTVRVPLPRSLLFQWKADCPKNLHGDHYKRPYNVDMLRGAGLPPALFWRLSLSPAPCTHRGENKQGTPRS